MECDVAVLGGGAAGLMCAIEAGKRGRRVTVLEGNRAVGRKILISGGGRCNFTNLHCRAENFFSRNPHFVKSALARYTPADFLRLVERHSIAWHEKKLGQLFCDGPAEAVVRMLVEECRAAGVSILTGRPIGEVRRGERFIVEAGEGTVRARAVVAACGGLSIPKLGATDAGYRVARGFGLRVVEPRPGLVPLEFKPEDRAQWGGLAGVAAEAEVAAGGRRHRERILFTHRGLSGPAVLQASSRWRPGEAIAIDLLPGVDFAAELRERKAGGERAALRTVLSARLPRRLAERWCDRMDGAAAVAEMADREIERAAAALHGWRVEPAGTEGFGKAEVTAGGVDTSELSSSTMEARTVPGLYFVGEVVDVTGDLGGFNFQWAWASGWAAGQAV